MKKEKFIIHSRRQRPHLQISSRPLPSTLVRESECHGTNHLRFLEALLSNREVKTLPF